MRILNRLGGIELARPTRASRRSRRRSSRSSPSPQPVHRRRGGAQGRRRRQAEEIFDLILKFGGYGFNKSHCTAYAIVAFQTAYLKTYYPVEFMAALLTFEMGRRKDRRVHRRVPPDGDRGLPPDVNLGRSSFQVAEEGKIDFALSAIKGVGLKAVEAIVAARAAGGRSPASTTSSSASRWDGRPGVCRDADQGGRLRRPGARRSQFLAVLPGPCRPARPSQDDRRAASGASSTPSAERQRPTAAPRARACPTSPSCPTPSGWPRRRRCSASTCRATP